jgi:hypothetical protein
MPGSIAAGDLLIAFGCTGGAQTFNLPSGWSWLVQNDVSDATDNAISIIYREAAGSDTLSWDMSGSVKGATIVWRITGAAAPGTQAPEIDDVAGATYTTTANTANPPLNTPTGGSKDYLFIAMGAQGGEVGAFTAGPTNYINFQAANSGTGGTPGTNCQMGGATRQLTAASEDAGVFTHAAADLGGKAFSVAVHPPPAATPSLAYQPAPSSIYLR